MSNARISQAFLLAGSVGLIALKALVPTQVLEDKLDQAEIALTEQIENDGMSEIEREKEFQRFLDLWRDEPKAVVDTVPVQSQAPATIEVETVCSSGTSFGEEVVADGGGSAEASGCMDQQVSAVSTPDTKVGNQISSKREAIKTNSFTLTMESPFIVDPFATIRNPASYSKDTHGISPTSSDGSSSPGSKSKKKSKKKRPSFSLRRKSTQSGIAKPSTPRGKSSSPKGKRGGFCSPRPKKLLNPPVKSRSSSNSSSAEQSSGSSPSERLSGGNGIKKPERQSSNSSVSSTRSTGAGNRDSISSSFSGSGRNSNGSTCGKKKKKSKPKRLSVEADDDAVCSIEAARDELLGSKSKMETDEEAAMYHELALALEAADSAENGGPAFLVGNSKRLKRPGRVVVADPLSPSHRYQTSIFFSKFI